MSPAEAFAKVLDLMTWLERTEDNHILAWRELRAQVEVWHRGVS